MLYFLSFPRAASAPTGRRAAVQFTNQRKAAAAAACNAVTTALAVDGALPPFK